MTVIVTGKQLILTAVAPHSLTNPPHLIPQQHLAAPGQFPHFIYWA